MQGWNLLEIFKVFPPINRVFLFYSITLQGCRTASCSSFSCNLGQLKLGDKVDIKMTFRLWINTLIKVCLDFQIKRASHYVFSFVFLGVTLYFHRASFHPGAKAIIRDKNFWKFGKRNTERVFAMEYTFKRVWRRDLVVKGAKLVTLSIHTHRNAPLLSNAWAYEGLEARKYLSVLLVFLFWRI